jgi:hypothetical protein
VGKRRAAAAALGTAVVVSAIAWSGTTQQGCQPQDQCTGWTIWMGQPIQSWDYGQYHVKTEDFPPGAGSIDDNTWQTGPFDGTWLPFNGGDTYWINPVMNFDGGGPPFTGPYNGIQILVSPDPQPNPGSNFAIASGNIAEVATVWDPTGKFDVGFRVTNATCAPYYLWLQITRHLPPAPLPLDAGDDGPIEASGDASADVSIDAPPFDASTADAGAD